jgi:hypothetical protein
MLQFGLRSGVIYPTYGLAENTVFVTSNGRRTLNVDRNALETDGKVRIKVAKHRLSSFGS